MLMHRDTAYIFRNVTYVPLFFPEIIFNAVCFDPPSVTRLRQVSLSFATIRIAPRISPIV